MSKSLSNNLKKENNAIKMKKEKNKKEESTSSSEDKSLKLINIKRKRKNEDLIPYVDLNSQNKTKKEVYINDKSSHPKDIQFSNEITKDSFIYRLDNNTFTVFKSYRNDLTYLIYANKYHSIISYDLINNQKLNEIINAHERHITFFKYYFDKINLIDLIISISGHNNNIKIWNLLNWVCILNLRNINEDGDLYTACILLDNINKINYLLTSNCYGNSEPIKVYNLKGKKIKEVKESKDNIIFMDIYYDRKLSKNYIITGNDGYIKSFDFKRNKKYYKYCDNDNKGHYSIVIKKFYKEVIKMIESSEDGNIRIWNFHSSELLNKINVSEENLLYGICLWDEEYLFIGCSDKTIKLININSGNIVKSLNGHKNMVINVKKINVAKYGECLLSQGDFDDQIKLWINKNNIKK